MCKYLPRVSSDWFVEKSKRLWQKCHAYRPSLLSQLQSNFYHILQITKTFLSSSCFHTIPVVHESAGHCHKVAGDPQASPPKLIVISQILLETPNCHGNSLDGRDKFVLAKPDDDGGGAYAYNRLDDARCSHATEASIKKGLNGSPDGVQLLLFRHYRGAAVG